MTLFLVSIKVGIAFSTEMCFYMVTGVGAQRCSRNCEGASL